MESTTAFVAMIIGAIAVLILLRMLDQTDEKGVAYVISTALLILCSFAIGLNIQHGNLAILIVSGVVGLVILGYAYKSTTGRSLIDKDKRK